MNTPLQRTRTKCGEENGASDKFDFDTLRQVLISKLFLQMMISLLFMVPKEQKNRIQYAMQETVMHTS